jgi:hypothetical protein
MYNAGIYHMSCVYVWMHISVYAILSVPVRCKAYIYYFHWMHGYFQNINTWLMWSASFDLLNRNTIRWHGCFSRQSFSKHRHMVHTDITCNTCFKLILYFQNITNTINSTLQVHVVSLYILVFKHICSTNDNVRISTL